ncbi:MAG: hypothetical protein AMXMBFR13_43660 [Phycisphaerae bacterium]
MAQPEQSAPGRPAARSTAEHIKETLESIVVAFVLAFVFRAFIVEAFVIPTGSMAVTLYGDQVTNTCSTCGFEYARGMEVGAAEAARAGRIHSIRLRCPNCDTTFDELRPAQIAATDSGDRILVHKWPFDVGGELLGPHRWDVTVFKDPRDGTTNFIKRLVGLPGEVLEIIDGDIYTARLDDLKKANFPVDEFDRLRLEVYALRGRSDGQNGRAIVERYAALNRQLLAHLKIQRKLDDAPRAQESLWFNVYNHDFLPDYSNSAGGEPADRVRWKPDGPLSAAAWDTSRREVTFRSTSEEPLFVKFSGKPIDDFTAYNHEQMNGSSRRLVGDLRLAFTWLPGSSTGGLLLEMNRDEDVFTAEINADGTISVTARQPGIPAGQRTLGTAKLEPFTAPVQIEFINVDFRVLLNISGQTVIRSRDEYAPDVVRLVAREEKNRAPKPSEVRIGARKTECELRHLVLQRDVYYRDAHQLETSNERPDMSPAERAAIELNPFHQWPGWGTTGMPILLRTERVVDGRKLPGEYFMLGDNSAASKVSRLWWEIGEHLKGLGPEYQVGTVTGDQLLGEAFFVYWPAGYRPAWAGGIGLVPNVGRMRWIR